MSNLSSHDDLEPSAEARRDESNAAQKILGEGINKLKVSMAELGRSLGQVEEELERAGIYKRPGVAAQGAGRGAEDQGGAEPIGKE
jgi:hypothetical protein